MKKLLRRPWSRGDKAPPLSPSIARSAESQAGNTTAIVDMPSVVTADVVDAPSVMPEVIGNATLPVPPSPPPSPSLRPRRLHLRLRPWGTHSSTNNNVTAPRHIENAPHTADPTVFPPDPASAKLPQAPILYDAQDSRMPRPASYPPFPTSLEVSAIEPDLDDSVPPPSLPTQSIRLPEFVEPQGPLSVSVFPPVHVSSASRSHTPTSASTVLALQTQADGDVRSSAPRVPSPVYEPAGLAPGVNSTAHSPTSSDHFSPRSRQESQSFTLPKGKSDLHSDFDDRDYSLPSYTTAHLNNRAWAEPTSNPPLSSQTFPLSSGHTSQPRAAPKRAKTSMPESSPKRREVDHSSGADESNSVGNVYSTGAFTDKNDRVGKPASANVNSDGSVPPIGANAPRSVEASPYSTRFALERSDSSNSVESKLYNAYADALHDEARSRAGGLRAIVNLLRDSDGNPIVIEKAALAIAVLSENDAATRDVFGQYSAVQMLIQCLSMRIPSKCDRTTAVEMIVYAIASLLKDSPRNVRLFEMFDGAHKMGKAAASERYENSAAIPNHALSALSELKHHAVYTPDGESAQLLGPTSSRNRAGSASSRTIRYVLRSMALHEHRVSVQQNGMDALRTLIGRADRSALTGHILRSCVQATSTAFKMHKESREIQWQCLALICDLEDVCDGLFTVPVDVVCLFGAMRMVITEAKDCARRKARIAKALMHVVKRAINVAVRNSWRNIDFKDSAVEAGAVETMLDALSLFDNDADTVDKVCTMLRVMLQSDEGRYRLNMVSSACAILGAIENANNSAMSTQPV